MKTVSIIVILVSIILCGVTSAQSPSLEETFRWITNTLRPQEQNGVYTLKPRFQSEDNQNKRIDPYHSEFISDFSHTGTKVTFKVIVTDNDMGLLLGLCLVETQVETFDLADIDPTSI